MKKTIAALILTAAVATPAMAQTYVHSNATATHRAVQARTGYDTYAYAPRAWNGRTGMAFATDPDPNVRLQLQAQQGLFDR